jgi:hypothetical protein
MQTQIQVTDDLVIELWPSGGEGDRPLLKLRNPSAERDGEDRGVVVYLNEVRHLIGALVDATVELATREIALRANDAPPRINSEGD